MKKNSIGTWVPLFVVVAMVTYYGCKKTDNPPPVTTGVQVQLATSTTLGQYLVDKNGVTLYFFADDAKGHNTCSGGCAAYWPYFSPGTLTQDNLGAGLTLADFDTVHVGSIVQARYKGWPLYYFAPAGNSVPETAGQITGESVANWFVAKPDYTIMLADAQLVGNDGKNYLGTYAEGVGKTVYFTDAKGVTLYAFSPDSFNVNKYTKADFSNNAAWPVYETTTVVAPSNLDKTKFSSISVAGHMQMTYNGWPLYYFGQDLNVRGNTKGVSVPGPGIWPVAVKDMASAPVAPTKLVKLATSGTLGQYLVDKDGNTLYFFSNDTKGRNSCSGGCATVWPYFSAGPITQNSLGAGLNIADFDTVMVGTLAQTRYKGWPLYYYAPGGTREAPGIIGGEAVSNWFVAKPDYSIMLANGQLIGGDGLNYLSTYVVGVGKTVYFTDAKGQTLYTFTPDSANINKYTKADFSNNASWPIYDTTLIVVPSALDKSLFSNTNVFGKHQLSYKGWPLYYFGGDAKTRGNTKGITVPAPGTKWPVAAKDINLAPHK